MMQNSQLKAIVAAVLEVAKNDIVKLAAETATKAVLETWQKKHQEYQREQYNTRLWNTRMLLRHYRSLKKYCESAVYDRKTAMVAEGPIEILEALGTCDKNTYIESIKSSVARTRVIMAHIDTMLNVYKHYCEASDKPEDVRKYQMLWSHYLAEEKIRIEDICQTENIDRSTFYRDNKESTELLSALIFGADGLLAMRKR